MEQARADRIFRYVLIAFFIYSGLYIFRTSFVLQGERYYSLFDDAMVSMRYAKNLANGYGLVWNPGGERVEGFTNPLWVVYMSLFHSVGLPAAKISLFIQFTGLLLLAWNLVITKKIALLLSESQVVALGAVILTAFYLPLNMWSLQGMEVSLLTLIVSICILRTLRSTENRRFDWMTLLLLASATLIRMDMTVTYFGFLPFLLFYNPQNRTKYLSLSILLLGIFLGGQTLFRYWYYGDFFPNTYYLKMTGYPLLYRISSGIYYFFLFTWKMNWVLFLFPFFFIAVRKDPRTYLSAWILCVQMAYSIYVGGDAWEGYGGSNRFISIAMPQFFILFSYALFELCQLLKERQARWNISLLIFSLIAFNSFYGPAALLEFLMIAPPAHRGDNWAMTERALLIKQFTNPQAKVAVTWSGTLPYFADRYAIDLLGKNDPRVARLPARLREGFFETIVNYQPGHMKYDYEYSLSLNPDVIAQLWKNQEEASRLA